LRDVQSLHWMAFFKYRTRTLAEMQERQFLSAAERKQLEAAYDFLLSVRNEMHYLATSPKHPSDALTKALQPSVAASLGYTDRSPSRRLEQFMRDLYNHMRNIFLITRMLEERLALLPNSICSRTCANSDGSFRPGSRRRRRRSSTASGSPMGKSTPSPRAFSKTSRGA